MTAEYTKQFLAYVSLGAESAQTAWAMADTNGHPAMIESRLKWAIDHLQKALKMIQVDEEP